MSGYSIVLNLSGNAVSRSLKLAINLERANVAAKSLAATLPSISRGIRGVGAKQLSSMGSANAKAIVAQARAANVLAEGELRRTLLAQKSTNRVLNGSHPYQTRHRSTKILSYGSGFNIGGLAGRFSTILQPDSNGMLLGLDANKLMKSVNVAGIATSLMASIGKSIMKVIGYSTFAPLAIGGGGLMLALKTLESEGFAEGVRLISRRHQAKLGLGEDFEKAQSNADYLAMSYGLDRGTTISSINVLSGLGVGSTGHKLSLAEGTDLTKIGGIISQHHGVPFERVMTNIQQLLVQDTPHLRDIREMLNQAPILGKYALKEMESRDIKGVDSRDYLKDQRNILSVLKTYEMDTATNAGMQARGRIGLSKQDAMAKIASNDDFWTFMGAEGSRTIESIGGAVYKLMTALANNEEFKIMVRNISHTFDAMGDKGVTLIDKLISLVDAIASKYGIDLGDKVKARKEISEEAVVTGAAFSTKIKPKLRDIWEEAGNGISKDPTVNDRLFETWLKSEFLNRALKDTNVTESVKGFGNPLKANSDFSTFDRWNPFSFAPSSFDIYSNNIASRNRAQQESEGFKKYNPNRYYHYPNIRNNSEPSALFGAYTIDESPMLRLAKQMAKERQDMGQLDASLFPSSSSSEGEDGSDLKGFNRDRKSLTINFNDKIIEWNSTIKSTNPQETVDEIAVNIEQMVSAGLQKALLGASGKMGSRWY